MDVPLDGREDLRFRRTHPITYKYIVENFKKVSTDVKPPNDLYLAPSLQPSAN